MADRRIKDIVTTTTSADSDDYLGLDGSTNGTRKVLWSSLNPAHAVGGIYITSQAATTISDTTNYFKLAGTTVLNNVESTVNRIDMPANNRLRYTGTKTIKAIIVGTLSFQAASNNQLADVRIYKYDDSAGTGTTLVHTEIEHKIGTGTDTGSVALAGDCVMDQNDYLEIWVKNQTSTASLTAVHMYFRLTGVTA